VIGGLAAGLVGNIIGFVGFGLLLGPRMRAEAAAALPAVERPGMSGGMIAVNITVQFVIGVLLVWLYAAMRPRFGPGFRTALYAAMVVWLCGFLFRVDWLLVGMMTSGTYALSSGLALMQVVAAASIGGFVYREGSDN
jgi:hypothetical protein